MQTGFLTGEAFREGQRAWPRVSLDEDSFSGYLLGLGVLTPDRLRERATDLFLACGCTLADPEALRYFDSSIISQVDLYIARFALAPDVRDDIRQQLRIKLLVGSPPGVSRYRGQGPLAAWVRIIAVRAALDVCAATNPLTCGDSELLNLAVLGQDNPEISVLRGLYRDRFADALQHGIRLLEPRDRTLLRLTVIDGLNIEAIGTIYRVHRATVARWLVAIRSKLVLSLRGALNFGHPPSPSEVRSLIGLLRDEIHLSASRILAAD